MKYYNKTYYYLAIFMVVTTLLEDIFLPYPTTFLPYKIPLLILELFTVLFALNYIIQYKKQFK